MSEPRLRLGVSACLLGQAVRYDGGHKRDGFVADVLAEHFELVAVCPEVAIGLGVPRAPIRLVQTAEGVRVRGVRDPALDVTGALDGEAARVHRELPDLCGYVLKKNSPSCGMERVKAYTETGMPHGRASGAFAAGLMARAPLLPVEEEGRLNDAELRENFIERVFAYARWQALTAGEVGGAALVDFHSRHKYQLLAHNQAAYRRLGRLVAGAGRRPGRDLIDDYGREFMAALARPASVGNHVNVLQHLAGYAKDALDAGDKAELQAAIDDYHQRRAPRLVPITLLRHHLRRTPHPWAVAQTYLNPDPREQLLRNHA
ncbi:MAG: YbgA family protein [Pseudomonadota bacterium]